MIRKLIVVAAHLAVVVLIVAVIGVLGAMAPKPEEGEKASFDPVVFVQAAEYEPVSLTVFAQGEVRPRQQIALSSQVGGKIVAVSEDFADGGAIRKGQVLVRIEDADFRLAVTRARAQVASAEQALKLERAEAGLARQDYEELAGIGAGAAPSALTLRQPQLARAEADYQAALASLGDAELALERAQIKAPFDGRVRSINANIGQFISPGFQLGTIFSTDRAEVRLPLTDQDLAQLQLPFAFNDRERGPKVDLSTIAAGAERHWDGRITRVDAAIDSSTRQIAAIAEVQDPYGAGADDGFPLAIGLYVDARIQGPQLGRAITLPRTALQQANIVYTIDDENRIVENVVEVAASTNDGVIITSGVNEGDRVVLSRLPAAVGSKVRPLTQNGETATRNAPTADPAATDTVADGALAGGDGTSGSNGGM